MRIKVLSGGRKSIELPLSDAELNFQMKRIGIEETVPVCRLVEASEKDNPLCKFEGQSVNMDEVNFFAKRMDCLTEYERKVLYSYVTDYGVGTMQDLINLTFSMKGLSLITDFSDAEQVGKRLYLDEFIAMPEEEKQQTNFIKFAEKTFKESRVEVLPYGVFVEHGFEMQEVYNGKTFPEYFASDEIVAAIEVQNQAGDTEYLYLPTDICSMNKVKERLQVMDFWEMKVTDIHNIRLPDILVPMPENIDCVEALTLFNETCQAVRHFDEVQMKQLAMVVEFTGFSSHTEVTSLAKLLGEFEVNPFVHNDEEYGKYMVEESGLFDVDELLLPLNSRDEFVTLRKFLSMEEFKSEHLAEELEIATHFLKDPEAAEIRDILMERASVGDVKRAAAFYKIIRYSYGSGCTSYGCQPFDIRKTFTILWEANRRLKDTVIENKDFEALIRQYDRPNAFFYCDPPYYETEGHYEVVFRKEDHVRLRDTLAGIEGKFMVSYNDCEYIRELYQDFQIEAVTRINNLAQRYDNGSEFPEVLIANYDMEERRKSLPTQMNLFELCGEQESVVWKCSKRKEDEDVSVSGDQGKSE